MSEIKPGLSERLEVVKRKLREAVKQSGRAEEAVTLIAVSKTFPIAACESAWQLGVRQFGENYVQEGVEKIRHFRAEHPDDPGVWHLIGPLQTNKTRLVAENFDWMHSLDRLKVAERLSSQRPVGMPPLNVLIEVNLDGEVTKSGLAPLELEDFARKVAALPGLRLRGLMAIPSEHREGDDKRRPFRMLKALFDSLKTVCPEMDTLSMGMSADMVEAVVEGSTMVRVGQAIFGPRDYSSDVG